MDILFPGMILSRHVTMRCKIPIMNIKKSNILVSPIPLFGADIVCNTYACCLVLEHHHLAFQIVRLIWYIENGHFVSRYDSFQACHYAIRARINNRSGVNNEQATLIYEKILMPLIRNYFLKYFSHMSVPFFSIL